MITVKISCSSKDWPLLRQTPGGKGIWDNYQFVYNKHELKECDYWIIYDDILDQYKEISFCDPGNVILFTGEPDTVKTYSKKFLNQFALIVTSQKKIKRKGVLYWQQALPWHVGRVQQNHDNFNFVKNYDNFAKNNQINKTKLISVIISNKQDTEGHKRRIEFVRKLKNHFGIILDVYGRGFNEIEDKWDAIEPYKYHIVLENTSTDDYWTEKLSDVYLAESFPIYYGCTNLNKYFEDSMLQSIDINNVNKSIQIIENLISSNHFENSKVNIEKAKKRILNEYNLFPTIISIIEKNCSKLNNKKNVKMRSQESCRDVISKGRIRMKKIIKKTYQYFIKYPLFVKDFLYYKKHSDKKIYWKDRYPLLNEKSSQTGFDKHYVYHTAWAAKVLKEISPKLHIDISSDIRFVTMISAFIPIEYYEYRAAKIDLENFSSKSADIVNLPFEDNSIDSLSCMHVVEHIGLGRYGDKLDPEGDLKGINELKRVVKEGGDLLFVVPIASSSKIIYNAHRVYSRDDVIELFNGFKLEEFVLIPDSDSSGSLIKNPDDALLQTQSYGCGCFWFKKVNNN